MQGAQQRAHDTGRGQERGAAGALGQKGLVSTRPCPRLHWTDRPGRNGGITTPPRRRRRPDKDAARGRALS
ncbi:hypothetical protein ACRAWD_24835 [Caulobacter segnis]